MMTSAVPGAAMLTVDEFLEQTLRDKPSLRLLEAGCGSASRLSFPGKQLHVTGIDISEKQLDRNVSLDEKICADIQYHEYPTASYDVIVCWDVLEHLPKPSLALAGFVRAISPGGLIILGVPNVLSVKGLVTKYTPHLIHVWVYRWLHGHQKAGEDDRVPFRTFHRYSARPDAIRKFARQDGLDVVYFETNDILSFDWFWRKGSNRARLVRAMYSALKSVGKVVTFGVLGDSDFLIVLRKPGERQG